MSLSLLRLALLFLLLATLPVRAQSAADSLAQQEQRVQALRDSLGLGIRTFEAFFNLQQREANDSLKQAIQAGPAVDWRDWAIKAAPRRGMTGEDILLLADLHARLNSFDMDGCYNEQLECYKRAMLMPGTEERALYRLHAEYLSAGFAPGMIQTGQRLLQLDKQKSMDQGVARTLALAYYFVGDRKQATEWIKKHLREHPQDERARELKQRIKDMQPLKD